MKPRVWIIDDDRSIRWVLEKTLVQAGFDCDCFDRGDGVFTRLKRQIPAAIMTDIRMPGIDGLELLRQLQEHYPNIPVIVMTAHSDLDSAVNAYQDGAFEYLPKPFDLDEAVNIVQRAIRSKAKTVEQPENDEVKEIGIIGEAPAMQVVFRAIGRLTHSHINVLINGESGTGKELVAKALHQHSPRSNKPFIALNMAAIPRELVESELFGHEKGAFTGASHIRQGRFEQANGGTLFLDEIGDMPMETQTRLLRVLADGEFYRVGGQAPVKVDVRIIAATHKDLSSLVQNNVFREDLYHRLNVIRVQLPRLVDRKEDIPALCQFFLTKAAQEMNTEVKQLTTACAEFLTELEWPGNVRQLENTCRLLTVMAPGREIGIEDIPPELRSTKSSTSTENSWIQPLKVWADRELNRGISNILDKATPMFEAAMIEIALKHTGGRKRDAANLLGWGRNTLTRKLKEFSLDSADETEETPSDS
ncbi:MAG TPA: nitrogen regulation protein NR(I) [Gammaproteobacteria bacterium]|nr:nitrogen regulation protein NR(I) [Pseudomonadota bacterium]HBF09645.1 nitrogen regulation protein NR(I) [Gammaproteobacteria bacterium]HCK94032.1 nitrogen regulation protein NR(I) [Gammaproteobacteria bacterium]|tara:strand:+ start:351 stop:1778 length:1428 start_codon:yes stop_codon:yes gene_type:complete